MSEFIKLQLRDIEFIEEIRDVPLLEDSTVLSSVMRFISPQATSPEKYHRICWG